MQADHPRLRGLTRSILGPESDARAATGLLLKWVYDYLEKVPLATLPDALETLDRGSGDCNEHAVLFATLARAAGVPARMVAGTVYGEDAFLYHAWVEVWLGMWVPTDPALGQFPADATHIKLVDGDVDAQMQMMAIIGKLGIEIVDMPIG
jgi:transglutaminase-like putative cysteine protease